MIAPFLGKSFESFMSLISLSNIEKLKNENDLRIMLHGSVTKNRKEAIPSKFFGPLLDKYHLSPDLDVSMFLKNQNFYYIVSSYLDLLPLLDNLELVENKGLKNILVFMTSYPTKKDERDAVKNMLDNLVPPKFRNNVVTINHLKLAEVKELCRDYLNTSEIKLPVKINADETFEFVFFDLESGVSDIFYDYLYSRKNLDTVFILPNKLSFKNANDCLEKMDKSKISIKNIYLQSDPMSFDDIAGMISLDNCKKVIHIENDFIQID